MKHFEIDPNYLTSVNYTRKVHYNLIGDYSHCSPEMQSAIHDLTSNEVTVSGTEDHEKFTELRNQLEREGYIHVERGWWNGDTVLKPFTLNGFLFKPGSTFSSAGAIGIKFKFIKDLNKTEVDLF